MVNGVVRDMTSEEDTQLTADRKTHADQATLKNNAKLLASNKRASAVAKLKALGLDDDEVSAITG